MSVIRSRVGGLAGETSPTNAEELEKSLERRRRAAARLRRICSTMCRCSRDPLTNTGRKAIRHCSRADYREEMLRRNGYDPAKASGPRFEVTLPFERATAALALILFLIFSVLRIRS